MIWTERLNMFTGFVLLFVGILSFIQGVYSTGFSWFIFGSMYLVMDSYGVPNSNSIVATKPAIVVRKVFAWVGAVAATILLVYTLTP